MKLDNKMQIYYFLNERPSAQGDIFHKGAKKNGNYIRVDLKNQ